MRHTPTQNVANTHEQHLQQSRDICQTYQVIKYLKRLQETSIWSLLIDLESETNCLPTELKPSFSTKKQFAITVKVQMRDRKKWGGVCWVVFKKKTACGLFKFSAPGQMQTEHVNSGSTASVSIYDNFLPLMTQTVKPEEYAVERCWKAKSSTTASAPGLCTCVFMLHMIWLYHCNSLLTVPRAFEGAYMFSSASVQFSCHH